MRRLDRYIFREILVPGLIALVALTFVVFSQKGGMLLDVIFRLSPTWNEIWAVVASFLPAVLTVTIPMGLLMGILTGFSRLSSDSEIIALRASGISMRRILRPVLAYAFLTWMVTASLSVWAAPQTAANRRTVLGTLALKYPALQLRPKTFTEKTDWPWVIWVNGSDTAKGIEMQGVLLVDTKNADQPEFTLAEYGSIAATNSNKSVQLTLTNSSRHSLSSTARYELSHNQSSTISIDLPPPAPPEEAPLSEKPTRYLWNRVREGTASREEDSELQQRLALPFACFAFALVGLPLGVSTNRGGRSTGLVLSLMLMFAYYLGFVGGTRATGVGSLSPFLGAWLPNIVFVILGIFLLVRSDRRHENPVISFLARFVQGVSEKVGVLKTLKPRSISISRWAYTLPFRFRLFRLLDAYVLRGFLFFFIIVLGVFSSLFIVVTLFELLPYIIRNRTPASTVIMYFAFLLPQIFYWVVPLAVLLAILINLGTLTKTNEILAVKAGAVSLYRMSLPIILMAAVLSGAVYVMQDYVLPWTNQKQDEYHDLIKGNAPQTYRDPHRKLMMGSENQLYHYTFFDPTSNTFGNLTILRLEPRTFQVNERIFAQRATWNGGSWMLEGGWIRQFKDGREVVRVETFDQKRLYEMDAPAYFKREVREADQMNYKELQAYVEELQRDGFDVGGLTVALYRKVSFPMVSFIMALIGVPFSFKTGRKGAFYGIGFCLAVGIIYWCTFALFEKLGGINQLSPVVAAWFPNIIFGASGFWMMLRMKT